MSSLGRNTPGLAALSPSPAPAGTVGARKRSNALIYAFGALGGLLFGYDTGVIAGALLFIRRNFALSPFLQGAVVSSLLFGALVGAAVSGSLSDRFGHRKLLIWAGALFTVGALAAAVSPGAIALIAARVVIGLAVGTASVQVPLYLSEMAPTRIRGGLSSLNQIMIGIGILTAYLVDYVLSGIGAWRWMVGLAVIPSLLLIAGMWFQPESPRWLMKHGQPDDAMAVLRRIRPEAEAAREFEEIALAARQPRLSLLASLRTRWMWPTLAAAAGLAIFQQIVGINTIIYYAPTILNAAGFTAQSAILLTVLLSLLSTATTIVAANLVDRIGRRPLLMGGAVGMALAMAALGWIFSSAALTTTPGQVIAVGCIAFYKVCFSLSWGPIVWVMLPEILPLRARGPAMGGAALFNWLSNFFVALVFPVLLFAGAGAVFAIFAVCALFACAFTAFGLRETSGRSLEAIEAEQGFL